MGMLRATVHNTGCLHTGVGETVMLLHIVYGVAAKDDHLLVMKQSLKKHRVASRRSNPTTRLSVPDTVLCERSTVFTTYLIQILACESSSIERIAQREIFRCLKRVGPVTVTTALSFEEKSIVSILLQ